MPNVVVEEGLFNRMRNALSEWNARRPAGEAEAIELYNKGHKAEGLWGFAGAQAPMIAPVVIGALIYAIVTSDWFNKIEIFKKHWWLKPALVFAAGLYLFRKHSPYAAAVLAVSGMLFAKGWKERPEAKETSGLDEEDAGRWEWDRRDDWRERENWRALRDEERRAHYLGETRAERHAERLADRIFEHARAA